jgi:pimeloyl-ACP methyl ester carboxylesterase
VRSLRYNFNDHLFSQNYLLPLSKPRPSSLSHAATARLSASPKSGLLPGESLLRYLSAPLLLGLVSPRELHSLCPPLRPYLEAREFAVLLASRRIRMGENSFRYCRYHGFLQRYVRVGPPPGDLPDSGTGAVMLHGFGASGAQFRPMMRAMRDGFDAEDGSKPRAYVQGARARASGKPGGGGRGAVCGRSGAVGGAVGGRPPDPPPAAGEAAHLLGRTSARPHTLSFAATPTNSSFALPSLAASRSLCSLLAHHRYYAPDLLGFGESEAPPLSYTQYVWEESTLDFVKRVVLSECDSFVVGGNSIGGYTAMSVSADDAATTANPTSASGLPGSNSCRGLVLFNSAGRVLLSNETAAEAEKNSGKTVADRTRSGLLGPFSAPPAFLLKAVSNFLLVALRPNIKSICKNLYPRFPERVNDELARTILRDSLDGGAVNVMIR